MFRFRAYGPAGYRQFSSDRTLSWTFLHNHIVLVGGTTKQIIRPRRVWPGKHYADNSVV